MPIIRAPGAARRSPAVIKARQDDKAERQAVKALQADMQAVLDGITPATTLAQLRGYTQDLARALRRTVRLL